jgi:hypothetical protein
LNAPGVGVLTHAPRGLLITLGEDVVVDDLLVLVESLERRDGMLQAGSRRVT